MDHHLAQVNIARPLEPLDSPLLAEFVAQLDAINALADRSRGFVWRLQDDTGNATSVRAFDDESLLINMSVWESVDDLAGFVYRSGHVGVMRRRREWFERMRMYMALWWIPAGHVPAPAEARARLEHLQEHGPTPFAFTFKVRFEPLSTSGDRDFDGVGCPA